MITLTFKVPPALEEAIALACRRERVTGPNWSGAQ